MTFADASNWTAGDLIHAVDQSTDGIVEATFWGVSVDFWCAGFVSDLPEVPGPWSVTIYPPSGAEVISEPVPSAVSVLLIARTLCRDWAPAQFDAWQTKCAIASGLQPGLPL